MTISEYIELTRKIRQVYCDLNNHINGNSMTYYASDDALMSDAKEVISDLEALTINFVNKINIEDCIKQ